MNKNYRLTEVSDISRQLLKVVKGKVLLFYGAMGTGKTTLIKELSSQLGVKDVVNSPTFSLVNEYMTQNKEIVYHFDFYRIEDESEAYDIGIEEYFYDNNWCLIEWPEKVENLLPLESVSVFLSINKDGSRNIQIKI